MEIADFKDEFGIFMGHYKRFVELGQNDPVLGELPLNTMLRIALFFSAELGMQTGLGPTALGSALSSSMDIIKELENVMKAWDRGPRPGAGVH